MVFIPKHARYHVLCVYIFIYTYVYLRLHLKEIYPLCTLPSFCIAIPGYLLCTSVKSSNHTISHTIHIYNIWCIYLQISVDFCYDFHVGKYTMWIFCGHGIPTWSPDPGLDLCPGVRSGARMGEGIRWVPNGKIIYPPWERSHIPPWRHIFEDECSFSGLVGYVSFLEGNYISELDCCQKWGVTV